MKNKLLFLGCFLVANFSVIHSQTTVEWAETYGGSGSELINGTVVDSEGSIYIAGDFRSTVDFDPGPGVFNLTSQGIDDVFIQKLDSLGNFVWAKSIGGVRDDQTYDLAIDQNDNVFVTGYFQDTVDFDPSAGTNKLVTTGSSSTNDAYVLKLNSLGGFEWVKQLKGAGNVVGLNIETDINGNVYVTGSSNFTADLDPGPNVTNYPHNGSSDIFLVKLDSLGNHVWSKMYGGTSSDQGRSITVNQNEEVYFAGLFRNTVDFNANGTGASNPIVSNGSSDVFIQKLDIAGNVIWTKSFGGTGQESISAIALDNFNNLFVTGDYSGNSDLDPSHMVQNFTTTGTSGAPDLFIQKFDSSGTLTWVKTVGGPGTEIAGDLAIDILGNVILCGSYQGIMDANPDTAGMAIDSLVSNGAHDAFVGVLNTNGDFISAASIGGTGGDYGTSVVSDINNRIILTGYFTSSSIDVDPGPGSDMRFSNGSADYFAVVFSPLPVGLPGLKGEKFKNLAVSPNPSEGQFTIKLNEPVFNTVELRVFDIFGKLIQQNTEMLSGNEIQIEIDGRSGIYFLEITSAEKRSVVQVIKQ